MGRPFTVVSDHEPLTLASHGRNSRRIQRYLLALSEYDYKIIYRRGNTHTVPDALSRTWSEEDDEVHMEQLMVHGVDGKTEVKDDEADAPLRSPRKRKNSLLLLRLSRSRNH